MQDASLKALFTIILTQLYIVNHEETRYGGDVAYLSRMSALDGGEWLGSSLATLPKGNILKYPLDRGLDGPRIMP
jgi:hypothetical protein